MAKLSTADFKKKLQEEIAHIAEEKRWNLNVDSDRGYAFQLWCAQTYANYDQEVETEPEAAMQGSKDLKADLVFEDSTRKQLVVAQCKYASLANPKDVDEAEVNDFFNRHERFMNRDWVRKHGSASVVDALLDYPERVKAGWKVNYYFFTTATASDRVKELVESINDRFLDAGEAIECALYDFPSLKDFYVRSLTIDESIPDEVRLQLPKGSWILKDEPYKTLVAIVKGNALRALYQQHKEALFAYNIRGYLGDRGINQDIRNTAEESPQHFYYFNNGISATCTDFRVDEKNVLIATKFQVINGAQTIGALRHARENSEVEVLLRVTHSMNVATEKGFNAEIIRFNNSQNVVKVSDFRANDPIQLWLEQQFNQHKGHYGKVLPELVYARKRGMKKRGRYSGVGIKLEDVAKFRYAFNVEPTRVLESPKDMWTPKADGGVYELAFGISGEVVECWTDAEFQELLLIIALFRFCDEETKKEAETPELKSFGRLKFHALSLAGMYFHTVHSGESPKSFLNSQERFNNLCQEFWQDARRVLIDAYTNATDREKSTAYAMARNTEVWEQIKKKFSLYRKLTRTPSKRDGG